MSDINWKADDWFARHYADEVTTAFKRWWILTTGPPEDYPITIADGHAGEYWAHCGISWLAWKAALKYSVIPEFSQD